MAPKTPTERYREWAERRGADGAARETIWLGAGDKAALRGRYPGPRGGIDWQAIIRLALAANGNSAAPVDATAFAVNESPEPDDATFAANSGASLDDESFAANETDTTQPELSFAANGDAEPDAGAFEANETPEPADDAFAANEDGKAKRKAATKVKGRGPGKTRVPLPPRLCKQCGKEFEPTKDIQTACSNRCRAAYNRAKDKADAAAA